MTLKFQRLLIIIISIILLLFAILLVLFNSKENIVFFYTPTELKENKLSIEKIIRIGGYVEENSFKKISLNSYRFKITDNQNSIEVFYKGILPDLFRENQGAVIEGVLKKENLLEATTVYAKHDENYMPESIKKELEKNEYWKKNYK